MNSWSRFGVVALLAARMAASPCHALTINLEFSGGDPPLNVHGEGNIHDIVAAAAAWWEAAIRDPHTISISYGWRPLAGIGGRTTYAGSVPPAPSYAIIFFDNDGTSSFFLDATPGEAEEYASFSETVRSTVIPGAESVNTGRRFLAPITTDAQFDDLVTLAAHEIGHALGYAIPMIEFPMVIDATLPKAGLIIIDDGEHILGLTDPQISDLELTTEALMAVNPVNDRTQNPGERKLPSELDILVLADRSGFTDIDLDPDFFASPDEPARIPVPAAALAALAGLLAATARRVQLARRRRRAPEAMAFTVQALSGG